jgi:transcriptional regulator with XRE-family HTH domain
MAGYDRVANTADRLREAMRNAGKTQADLVRDTGIGKSNISRYLSGRFDPKSDAVHKLAIALNVSEMWLWGCDVPMERPAPEELGTIAADVLLNPKLTRVTQIFMELDEAEQDMYLMLLENLHQKTKKG